MAMRLTFSIIGGADAARFAINATSGALTFTTPPNFEAPADAGANNSYDVTVQVSDGTQAASQAIRVDVGSVNEVPTALQVIGDSVVEQLGGRHAWSPPCARSTPTLASCSASAC